MLQKVNLKTRRQKSMSSFQAFEEQVRKEKPGYFFMKTQREQTKIVQEDWKKLSKKNRDFYSKISEAKNLTREFEESQKFYKERIE